MAASMTLWANVAILLLRQIRARVRLLREAKQMSRRNWPLLPVSIARSYMSGIERGMGIPPY